MTTGRKTDKTKYFIAADGGGTKLIAVLFDENLNVLRAEKTGGINEIFKSGQAIGEELKRLSERLLSGTGVGEIEELAVSLASRKDTLLQAVSARAKVKNYTRYNEGETVLAAHGLKYGIAVQAGTGSDVFVFQPHRKEIVGGLGAYLGDEGSGFEIGCSGIKAAVAAYMGIGEKTSLYPAVFGHFSIAEPRDLLSALVRKENSREMTAHVSYIVAEEAEKGDKIARKIFRTAGERLAALTIYGIERCHAPQNADKSDNKACAENVQNQGAIEGEIVASGGAWKGHRGMFRAFSRKVRKKYPEIRVRLAELSPLAGVAALTAEKYGKNYAEIVQKLKNDFNEL